MVNFEIKAKDGLARLGRFTTKHGTVSTPLLMPVIHPGKTMIPPQDIVDVFGFQMVITNSYIINSHERFREKAISEGVHGLLNFDHPIMTDSGTFQMYFHDLPEEEIDPLAIIEFQKRIKTDIGTILDAFSKPDVGREQVEKDVKLSLERARMSVGLKDEMMLAGTVQGGIYEDLREQSAKEMGMMDFDVYPIGGVVPLMEMYRYADIVRITLAVKKHLPPDRPVHLFGCGHPMLFAQAALLGCDFFDSASYAKFADTGRMLLTTGTVHLKDLSELPCECPVCSNTTASELQSLPEKEKSLALMRHNLYVSAAEMRRVRQAITEGKLFELAAQHARNHPALLEALHVMVENMDQLVESDPFGKSSSIFYTGFETSVRPEISRFHQRVLDRYPYRKTETVVIVPDLGDRPFSDTAITIIAEVRKTTPEEVILLFVTPMGVIPWELEHIHPSQQCIFSKQIDPITLAVSQEKLHKILEMISFNKIIWFEREGPTNQLIETLQNRYEIIKTSSASETINAIETNKSERQDWYRRKLKALLIYQWGESVGKIADSDELQVVFSKNTGKIRHVTLAADIIFTVVPTTGLLTPTFRGGEVLLQYDIDKKYIVIMEKDASEFVANGKSALAKFVVRADSNLKAGEEVLITDEKGQLVGTGKALLSGNEMSAFSRGVAVFVRHSSTH